MLAPVTWVFGPIDSVGAAALADTAARRPASCATVRNRTDGPSLNEALAQTGMLQLAFCVLLSAGPAAEPVKLDV